MNLFTVLASAPRKSFPEEHASAVLAWLLQPGMDHGLGSAFVGEFLSQVLASIASGGDGKLREMLQDVIDDRYSQRAHPKKCAEIVVKPEYFAASGADSAAIDIVVTIGDWVIAIENKIYEGAYDGHQLQREYAALKGTPEIGAGSHILFVFLVPKGGAKASKLFESLSVGDQDLKALVTWQSSSDSEHASVSDVIAKMLEKDALGEGPLMQDIVRHTLKSLRVFCEEDFGGDLFGDSEPSPVGGRNPETESVLRYKDILGLAKGFVGVKGGVVGLLGMIVRNEVAGHSFQYTTSDGVSGKPTWLPVERFREIVEGVAQSDLVLEEQVRVRADVILELPDTLNERVCVGVRGGAKGLNRVLSDRVERGEPVLTENDRWSIGTDMEGRGRRAEWMKLGEFKEIVASPRREA